MAGDFGAVVLLTPVFHREHWDFFGRGQLWLAVTHQDDCLAHCVFSSLFGLNQPCFRYHATVSEIVCSSTRKLRPSSCSLLRWLKQVRCSSRINRRNVAMLSKIGLPVRRA